MSKKFRDRILEGSGFSNKKFECDFGLKLLQKMGWKEGNGLGRDQQGTTECVQIKRREEGLGLGVNDNKKKFEWNDSWWENSYKTALQSISVIKNEDSENTSDQSSSNDEKNKKMKKTKTAKVVSTKKQSKKEEEQFDHLFSSCSSSSDEEPIYKKKKNTESEKTKKIKKGSSEDKKNKKLAKLVKNYSAESESDD